MIAVVIIFALTLALMICSILFFPTVRMGKRDLDVYPIITLLGALAMIVAGLVSPVKILEYLISDSPVNPLKILILFISMTILSVYLDEHGFFRLMAVKTVRFAGKSQHRLFVFLYIIVSVLTLFTSNDIIILSFTPFICFFAKHSKINPLPYLFEEFVAANTWSMLFEIGNPTNIYIASAYSISFMDYFFVMAFPTLAAGLVSFMILFFLFKKQLSTPMVKPEEEDAIVKDRLSLCVGIALLSVCTLALAVSSYIHIEMWIISLSSAVILIVYSLVRSAVKKEVPKDLGKTIERAPWQLVPFVLSLFVMILAADEAGISGFFSEILRKGPEVYSFGIGSFIASNLINNIPMSVLFCDIIGAAPAPSVIFSTVAGSNLGAFLTPVGALAGIMWTKILGSHNEKMSYGKFVMYGSAVSVPSLMACLTVLMLITG